jgi:hypothetical protein
VAMLLIIVCLSEYHCPETTIALIRVSKVNSSCPKLIYHLR